VKEGVDGKQFFFEVNTIVLRIIISGARLCGLSG
jgi:hypothetical protein